MAKDSKPPIIPLRNNVPFHFLWERGDYRGGEIGRVFGLGEPSVSRRARMAKDKLAKDRKFRARFEKIKSLINV